MSYTLHEEWTCSFTGGPLKPLGFAIHWWGDPIQKPTFRGTVDVLLARALQQSASVNFVASAGEVACLVSPDTVAWAQGDGADGWGNNNLVSIECNPRCSAEDRETVAELIADQHILNGIPIVLYPHKKFTATQCPGVWEQYIPWLVKRANELVALKQSAGVKPESSKPSPPVKKPPVKVVKPVHKDSEIHWVVERGDTLGKISQYYYGDMTHIAQLKAHNGIADANKLSVGQKVFIPGPLVWNIEAPDTIRSIAKYYGLDPAYLAKKNGLSGPDATIYIGNQLKIL